MSEQETPVVVGDVGLLEDQPTNETLYSPVFATRGGDFIFLPYRDCVSYSRRQAKDIGKECSNWMQLNFGAKYNQQVIRLGRDRKHPRVLVPVTGKDGTQGQVYIALIEGPTFNDIMKEQQGETDTDQAAS